MNRDPTGALLMLGILSCLLWAGVEARGIVGLHPRSNPCATVGSPTAVEESFAPILRARQEGRAEEALLELRSRVGRGPYPGYAWFLLGEAAYREGALGAAVRHYRAAVDTDPAVSDRDSAFGSARLLQDRLDSLRKTAWAKAGPAEMADLRYLQRRIAGGCE